jgi:hypothetical protein
MPLSEGTVVIFNQNLALNSHLQAQHENLNHQYIPLGMLSNAEGLPFQETTSNSVVGTGIKANLTRNKMDQEVKIWTWTLLLVALATS